MTAKDSLQKLAWSPTTISLLSFLLLPFRVFYRSHLYYLLYVVLLAYGIYYGTDYALNHFEEWLQRFYREYSVSLETGVVMHGIGKTVVYALVAPIIIAILAAPVRHIFFYNRIRPALIAQELPHGITITLHASIIMATRLFYGLIPVFVLVGGYLYWASGSENQALPQVYVVTGGVVCFLIIVHQIPFLFAPFMAATSGFNPMFCVSHAPDILSHGRTKIAFMMACCAGLLVGSEFLILQYVPPVYQESITLGVCIFWLWYFANHILYILLVKTLRYQRGDFASISPQEFTTIDEAGPVFIDNIDFS